MTKEKEVNLPPQYHDLLIESGRKIGLNLQQISTALKTLVSKEESSLSDYDDLIILFKAISEREFPFIVLVTGDENKNLKSVDLLPDPQLVNVVANRQKVVHLFSRADSRYDLEIAGFSNKKQLTNVIQGTIKAHLRMNINNHSKKPYTVAIAGTQNPGLPHLVDSLSFGFPYKEKINQIQMGLIRKTR